MKQVVAAAIMDGKRLLLARRSPDQKLAGFWELPGGKVEEGETLQSSIERELQEELGIASVAGAIIGSSDFKYDHGEFRIIAIDVSIHSKAFVLNDHDLIEWFEHAEAKTLQLAPADIPLIDLVFEYYD